MAYEVRRNTPAQGEDVFDYVDVDGITHSVPKAKYVPMDKLIELEGDATATRDFFPGSGKMYRSELKELLTAWRADSDLTAGESQAS